MRYLRAVLFYTISVTPWDLQTNIRNIPDTPWSGWRVVTTGKTEPQEDVTSRNLEKERSVIHR
jgi:hypothetical protein